MSRWPNSKKNLPFIMFWQGTKWLLGHCSDMLHHYSEGILFGQPPIFVLLVSTTMPTALRFVLCESSVALGKVLGSLAPHTHISKEGCQDKFQVNLYSPTLGISKSNRHSSMLWKRWNWLFYIRFFPENYTGTSPSLHPAPKKARPVRVPPWVFSQLPDGAMSSPLSCDWSVKDNDNLSFASDSGRRL